MVYILSVEAQEVLEKMNDVDLRSHIHIDITHFDTR